MWGFFMTQFFKKPSHKTICKCLLFHTLSYLLYLNAHNIVHCDLK